MNKYRIGILAVLALCFAVALGKLWAASAQAPPTAEFLAAALQSQEAACGDSLEVNYTIAPETTKVPSGYADPKTTIGHPITRVHYVRTPDRQFAEEVASEDGKELYSKKQTYDRATGQSRTLESNPEKSNGYGLIAMGRGLIGRPELLDPILICSFQQPLQELCAIGSVSSEMELIDGHSCYKINIAPGQGDTESRSIWLDPSVGFCPRRIAVLRADGSPRYTTTFFDYKTTDGVWFPWRMEIVCTDVDGSIWNTVHCQAIDLSLGKAFSKDSLAVTFPSGTEVVDRVLNLEYTVP